MSLQQPEKITTEIKTEKNQRNDKQQGINFEIVMYPDQMTDSFLNGLKSFLEKEISESKIKIGEKSVLLNTKKKKTLYFI